MLSDLSDEQAVIQLKADADEPQTLINPTNLMSDRIETIEEGLAIAADKLDSDESLSTINDAFRRGQSVRYQVDIRMSENPGTCRMEMRMIRMIPQVQMVSLRNLETVQPTPNT